jgi:cytochrome c-type biogenesis protein CcmH/NrfG
LARGTQHRKRRPTANARTAAVAAPARRKKTTPQWQEELFFQRLRNHAKWAYVALAGAFILTFVFLGVGSGSTGVSDALQNAFKFGGSGGTSISSLQKKVEKAPTSAAAWRNLATAYETKQRTSDAIGALERYVALKPKDQGALQELATQYRTQADAFATDYSNAQALAASAPSSGIFSPPSTTPLGKALQSLQDPISQAIQTEASGKQNAAYSGYITAQTHAEATFRKLVKLSPDDASMLLELGQAASAAQDYTTAISSYKKFLKVAPHDVNASQVKQLLKSAETAAKSAGASTGTTG